MYGKKTSSVYCTIQNIRVQLNTISLSCARKLQHNNSHPVEYRTVFCNQTNSVSAWLFTQLDTHWNKHLQSTTPCAHHLTQRRKRWVSCRLMEILCARIIESNVFRDVYFLFSVLPSFSLTANSATFLSAILIAFLSVYIFFCSHPNAVVDVPQGTRFVADGKERPGTSRASFFWIFYESVVLSRLESCVFPVGDA